MRVWYLNRGGLSIEVVEHLGSTVLLVGTSELILFN